MRRYRCSSPREEASGESKLVACGVGQSQSSRRCCPGRPNNETATSASRCFKQLDSLEEYVLVSQDERRIEVRRREGRNWSTETRVSGETIQIHGLDIAVDAIYS